MRFSTLLFALASAVAVSAADIQVLVGDAGGLTFTPPSVTAVSGDTINFEFRSKNHSVTQSSFANPCTFLTTPSPGVDSGFQPVAAGATSFPAWSFTIDDPSTPLWFFCAQTGHCKAGMVFAVNAPADKTFASFQASAMSGTTNSTTGSPSGSVGSTPVPSPAGSSATPIGSGFSTVVGYPPASTGTNTNTNAIPATTGAPSDNGALRLGGSAASIVAIVGLVAGLIL